MITCPIHGHEGVCPICFGESMIKLGAQIQGIKSTPPSEPLQDIDYKSRAEALEFQLAAFKPYIQHKPSCDLSGRDWPVTCTCGLDALLKQ